MLLPKRDFDTDYDDPDVVMSWPRILGTFVLSMLLLAIVALPAFLASLLGRAPPRGQHADPIRAAQAKAGEG